MSAARLLISCPDRPGIVAAVAEFVYKRGGNILTLDQHSTDPAAGTLFMRMEFELNGVEDESPAFEAEFEASVAQPFVMDWRLAHAGRRKAIMILASREDHCALDLILRCRSGELDVNLLGLISNHRDLEDATRLLDVPFFHVPTTPETKRDAEGRILARIGGAVDLVVLARYMQILSDDFLKRVGAPIINIHHSFLPAFIGANPYDRAFERGVKIIGATAHYVTAELDEGPIIEQDVIRVSHRDGARDMKQTGRDVERVVLARAVRWHLEDRVLRFENRTVVFQ